MSNRLQLQSCAKSTPSAKIPKWRSTLHQSFPITINEYKIKTEEDIIQVIKEARENNLPSVQTTFANIDKIAMHPQKGVPILYHDQLNIVAKHIAEIKDSLEQQGYINQRYLEAIIPTIATIKSTKKKAKLTRRILKIQTDWYQ